MSKIKITQEQYDLIESIKLQREKVEVTKHTLRNLYTTLELTGFDMETVKTEDAESHVPKYGIIF